MNDQTNKQSSIVNRIKNGSVKIDSVAEFNNILKIFPNDPWVHKFHADLLKQEQLIYAAAEEYGIASELFIEADMTLQTLASKILEWRILGPSDHEARLSTHLVVKASPKKLAYRVFS